MRLEHIVYLKDSFELLSEKIRSLAMYASDTDNIFENTHKTLMRDKSIANKLRQVNEGIRKAHNFHYRSPSSGGDLMLSTQKLSYENCIELNTLHKLKIYQWLLTEAYEAFEDYVEKSYAYCGLEGLSVWHPLANWAHEGSKDINVYLKCSEELKKGPYEHLNRLRDCSNHFARYETNNQLGNNYRVILVLTEKLRHLIVHNGGYCDNFNQLISKAQRHLPNYKISDLKPFFESYFTPHKGRLLVDLLEFPVEDEMEFPTGAHYDTMLGLFRNLVEYAYLICESIILLGADTKFPSNKKA